MLERLFQAFGHAGLKEAGATLEMRVTKAAEAGGGTAFADLVWKPVVLVEMKRRGTDFQKHLSPGLRLLDPPHREALRSSFSGNRLGIFADWCYWIHER